MHSINSDDVTVLVRGAIDAIEWACVLCGHHIQNDWVEQQICIQFSDKIAHSSAETIWMTQKAAAMGNWWLAASPRQCACSGIMARTEICGESQITQVTQIQYSTDLVPCDIWLFPKLKSLLKGKRFQTIDKIQENMTGLMMANCVRSQGAYFEGDWSITFLCTMFLISFSINISIFHSAWLWKSLYLRDRLHICHHDMRSILLC